MTHARSDCPKCNGRGGALIAGRWRRCDCTRPNRQALKLLRQANAIGAKRDPNKPLTDE